jgi:hypothetical protein
MFPPSFHPTGESAEWPAIGASTIFHVALIMCVFRTVSRIESASSGFNFEDQAMATAEKPSGIPASDMAELEKAVQDLMKGVRNPEKMRQAAEEMDRTREAIYRRIGLVDFAVPTIRDLRDGDHS